MYTLHQEKKRLKDQLAEINNVEAILKTYYKEITLLSNKLKESDVYQQLTEESKWLINAKMKAQL